MDHDQTLGASIPKKYIDFKSISHSDPDVSTIVAS